MLNVDGVIQGNYRTCLVGSDLNRRWKKPKKKIYPSIAYAKDLIKAFSREREIKMIIDIHGHNRKYSTIKKEKLFLLWVFLQNG